MKENLKSIVPKFNFMAEFKPDFWSEWLQDHSGVTVVGSLSNTNSFFLQIQTSSAMQQEAMEETTLLFSTILQLEWPWENKTTAELFFFVFFIIIIKKKPDVFLVGYRVFVKSCKERRHWNRSEEVDGWTDWKQIKMRSWENVSQGAVMKIASLSSLNKSCTN